MSAENTPTLTNLFPFVHSTRHFMNRPGVRGSIDKMEAAYESLRSLAKSSEHNLVLAVAIKEIADVKAYGQSPSYAEARGYYMKAVSHILGVRYIDGMELPTLGRGSLEIYEPLFLEGEPKLSASFALLVLCFYDIALCYLRLDNLGQAIDCFQEIEILYNLHFQHIAKTGYPWEREYKSSIFEFGELYNAYRRRLSDVFYGMLNTAAANHFSVSAKYSAPPTDIMKAFKNDHHLELMTVRHPDFENVADWKIVEPDLQIRGNWNKIDFEDGRKPQRRDGHTCWIWHGLLYVYGGKTNRKNMKVLEELTDFWCFDLRTKRSWRRLPSPPNSMPGHTLDTKACVWNDHAWIFFGHLHVLMFNMRTEKWAYVETEMPSGEVWPYTAGIAREYCAEVFEGVLHIFGGDISPGCPGSNLHMALDLCTLYWSKLGGTTDPKQLIKEMPPLRLSAGSWVVPEERRMFILYGYASPTCIPSVEQRPDYQHDDMWSYSFDERLWRRERFRGNFPSPRAKMACTYSARLQHVVVFGGINLRFPTDDMLYSKKTLFYTPLGDTFVLDLKTRIWRQVVTRNFPHHRSYMLANVDEATGKIYLFGGGCPLEFLPSKHAHPKTSSVCLRDLWQLDVDLPRGTFVERGSNADKQVDKFGPWKLCSGCGSYKDYVLVCGGTCGGRISLCSTECQKNCWLQHRHLYSCQNIVREITRVV